MLTVKHLPLWNSTSTRLVPATAAPLRFGTAAEYLSAAQGGWDIVFVDPPFEAQLGESTLQQIATAGCLMHNNRVYYETSLSNPEPIPEMLYEVVREKTAGDVRYQLLTLRRA